MLVNVFNATRMKSSSFCGVSNGTLARGQILRGPFPSFILDIGMDNVYWETAHFLEHQNVRCRINQGAPFGGGVFKSQWSEFSYCPIPSLSGVQNIQVSISYNGTEWAGPYDVAVKSVYGVSSYGPNTGSRDGGTEVTIIGQNFVQGVTGCNPAAQSTGDPDCAVCFFGNGGSSVAVPAIVVSSTEVRCVTPPWQSLGSPDATITFSISMNYFLAYGPFDFTYTLNPLDTPLASEVNVTHTPLVPLASTLPVPPTDTGMVPNVTVATPRTEHVSGASLLVLVWLNYIYLLL